MSGDVKHEGQPHTLEDLNSGGGIMKWIAWINLTTKEDEYSSCLEESDTSKSLSLPSSLSPLISSPSPRKVFPQPATAIERLCPPPPSSGW